MTLPLQVSPADIWQRVLAGQALLVCAYDDQKKFRENHLEGARSMAEFRARMKTMDVNQEIVFYCACSEDATSVRVAEKFLAAGFTRASVLKGGVEAWKKAGYPVVSG